VEQAITANAALRENAVVPGGYITAILSRLDLPTGSCSLLNAGHVPPLHVRDGEPQEAGRVELTYQTIDVRDAPGQQLLIGTPGPGSRSDEALAYLAATHTG
jgi:stage II sporulation SpoE-like protein